MDRYGNSVDATSFGRGDFVREKLGRNWMVGVVWDVHPRNAASVEVYYPVWGKTHMPREYRPEDLSVVPVSEVSEDLLRFRASMER